MDEWIAAPPIAARPSAVNEQFGRSIAVDGDLLAVGADAAIVEDQYGGAVFVYRRQAGAWEEVGIVAPDGRQPSGQFGLSVDLEDGWLVTGAPYKSVPGILYTDEAYVHDVSRMGLVPVADAGDDITVYDTGDDGVESIALDGAASSDPGGEIVGWTWTWEDGGSQSASGVNPTVSLPVGVTTITLTVTNDLGAMASDTVTVAVLDPDLDDDGLDDAFEQQIIDARPDDVFDSPESVNPDDDFDGDGFSNAEEAANGTSPISIDFPFTRLTVENLGEPYYGGGEDDYDFLYEQRIDSCLDVDGAGLVAVPAYYDFGNYDNVVVVFRQDGDGDWTQEVVEAPHLVNTFGADLSIQGNELLVGAPWKYYGLSNGLRTTGGVYSFGYASLPSPTWTQNQLITEASPGGEDLGGHLARDGAWLAVSGSAGIRIYEKLVDGWHLRQLFSAPALGQIYESSSSWPIQLEGEHLICGHSYYDQDGAPFFHKIVLYRRAANNTWSLEESFDFAGGEGAVATLDGQVVALGHGNTIDLYEYDGVSGLWVTAQSLETVGTATKLALDGSVLIALLPGANAGSGDVTAFRKTGGVWERVALLRPPSGGAYPNWAGITVAEGFAFVTSPFSGDHGAIDVYDLSDIDLIDLNPNQSPFLDAAPSASPQTVTIDRTDLTVVARDDGGAANLIYTWSVSSAPGGANAQFMENGTNGASTTTVVFDRAGTYTLGVIVTDGGGLTALGQVDVEVLQDGQLEISPADTDFEFGGSTFFSVAVVDQFGDPIGDGSPDGDVSWSLSGGGTISASTGYVEFDQPPSGVYELGVEADGLVATRDISVQLGTNPLLLNLPDDPWVNDGGVYDFSVGVYGRGDLTVGLFDALDAPLGNPVELAAPAPGAEHQASADFAIGPLDEDTFVRVWVEDESGGTTTTSFWISVLPAGTGSYPSWVAYHGLPVDSSPLASSDGMTNLMRYAFGLPLGALDASARSRLPRGAIEERVDWASGEFEATPHLVFRYLRSMQNRDLAYRPMFSTDLVDWDDVVDEYDFEATEVPEGFEARCVAIPLKDQAKGFVRIVLEIDEP